MCLPSLSRWFKFLFWPSRLNSVHNSYANGFDPLFDSDRPFRKSPSAHSLGLTFDFATQSTIVFPDGEPGSLTESQYHQFQRDQDWTNEVFSTPSINPSFLSTPFPPSDSNSPAPTPSSAAPATPASARFELPTISTSTGKRKRDDEVDPELSYVATESVNDNRPRHSGIIIQASEPLPPLHTPSPQHNPSPSISFPDERATKRVRSSNVPIRTVTAGPSTPHSTSIQPPKLFHTKAFESTPKTRRVKATFVSENSRDLHEWLGALFGTQSEVRGQTARLNNTKCFICKYTDPSKADATQSTMKRHVLSHFQETLKIIIRHERDGSPYRQIIFIHHLIPTLQRLSAEGGLTISLELQREIETFLRDHASIVPDRPFPTTLTFCNQNTFSTSRFPNLYKSAKEHTQALLEEHICQCGAKYGRRDLLKKHVKSKLVEVERKKKIKEKNDWNHGYPGRTGDDRWKDFNLTASGEEIRQKHRADLW